MPVGVLRKKTKARDFFRWQKYISKEDQRLKKSELMMARLTYEVYLLRWVVSNLFAKKASEPDLKMDDFIPKHEEIKKKVKKLTFAERLAISENAWAAALGGFPTNAG